MTAAAGADRTLTRLVWAIAVGILLQAVTAGQFISGLANVVGVHSAVGTVLELVGFALVIVAASDQRTRRNCRARWLAVLLLGIAVIVQASLGHAPGAVPTAIHVPVGVALFAWATVLAFALTRPASSRSERHEHVPPQRTTQAGSA